MGFLWLECSQQQWTDCKHLLTWPRNAIFLAKTQTRTRSDQTWHGTAPASNKSIMEKKIVIHFNVPFTKPSPISCQDPLLHSIGALVIQKTPNIISRRNSFEANYPSTTWHVLFGVPDVSVVPFLQLSPLFLCCKWATSSHPLSPEQPNKLAKEGGPCRLGKKHAAWIKWERVRYKWGLFALKLFR